MIFNGIKLAAAKNKITELVEARSSSFSFPIRSLGIILDEKNKSVYKDLQLIKEHYKVKDDLFQVFYYSADRALLKGIDAICFSLKDFTNKAEINNEKLAEISSREVNLLITFAAENNKAAHLLTAYHKAGIKVGRFQQNAALYDIILKTEADAPLFVKELIRYLKQFEKSRNE